MVLGIDELEYNHDRSLVDRVQLGDEDAFAELYRRHHDRLYRYCLYRLGEEHEAQDVVQEAFTRAWINAPKVKGDLRFYPWLRTIAGNLCTDVGRRRARVQPAPAVDPGPTDGGQERIIETVDLVLLEQAMSRLPERHRSVLKLREADGLTYEQLADRTGTTVGTVESLLWRARQGLKRHFAVVSGESLLAGLPVLGRVLRRAHAIHSRVAARMASSDSYHDAVLTGVGGVAIGSAVAVAFVINGVGGHAYATPPVQTATPAAITTSTVQALMSLAAQPVVEPDPATTTNRSHITTRLSSTAPAQTPRTHTVLTNPVRTDPAARQEAGQDPLHVAVGTLAAGVNPQAVIQYAAGLVSNHPVIP